MIFGVRCRASPRVHARLRLQSNLVAPTSMLKETLIIHFNRPLREAVRPEAEPRDAFVRTAIEYVEVDQPFVDEGAGERQRDLGEDGGTSA